MSLIKATKDMIVKLCGFCYKEIPQSMIWPKQVKAVFVALLGFLLVVCAADHSFAQTITSPPEDFNITVKVPGTTSSLLTELVSSPSSGQNVYPSTEIFFTYRYRLTTGTVSNAKVEIHWKEGSYLSGGTQNIPVFDYVVGSASVSEEGVTPVVDLLNRKIVWIIPTLHSSINYKSVNFRLRVRGNVPVTGHSNVKVEVLARTYLTPSSYQQKNTTHFVQKSPEPTAIPNVLTPQPLKPPYPIDKYPQITRLEIVEIRQDSATISFSTNIPTRYVVKYGTSPLLLAKSISGDIYSLDHVPVGIPDLTRDSVYYFEIYVRDSRGAQARSDIVSFRTSSLQAQRTVTNALLIWNGILLVSAPYQTASITQDSRLNLAVTLNDPRTIRSVQAVLSHSGNPSIQYVSNLVETLPGVYSGATDLRGLPAGLYKMKLIVYDIYSSVQSIPLEVMLQVIQRGKVIDRDSKEPIEGARITIKRKKTFHSEDIWDDLGLGVFGEIQTDIGGNFDLALGHGEYEVTIERVGYLKQTHKLLLPLDSQGLQLLFELNQDPSILSQIQYQANNLNMVSQAFLRVKTYLGKSLRIRDIMLVITSILCLMTLMVSRADSLLVNPFKSRLILGLRIVATGILVLTVNFVISRGFLSNVPQIVLTFTLISFVTVAHIRAKSRI